MKTLFNHTAKVTLTLIKRFHAISEVKGVTNSVNNIMNEQCLVFHLTYVYNNDNSNYYFKNYNGLCCTTTKVKMM